MKNFVYWMSVLFCFLFLVSCTSDEEEYRGVKDFGAGGSPEANRSCTDAGDCDDGNPCTIDHCYEGFCDYQNDPIDEDLDGYVSRACGGPDCDDENRMVHPGVLESPYDDTVCSDGVDNDCNGRIDEEDAGCFHCDTAEDCDAGTPGTQPACVAGRCAYTDRPGPCDDGDACTVHDACFGGVCTGDPLDGDGDGYVAGGCGGDDCDDSLAGVHPGAREGPPEDPSCGDGVDNDCDGLTDADELACRAGNKLIDLTTDGEVAPTGTDLEVAFTVGSFQGREEIPLTYAGGAKAVYVPAEDRVWMEEMSLEVDPVNAGISLPMGTLTIELKACRLALEDREGLILDPEGVFSANVRLRVDVIASVSLNALPIIEDYPLSILSEDMTVSGRWTARGDTDADGRDEFDLLVTGALSYGFSETDIPLLGEVAATLSGSVELGFRGEEG